ncbi:TetR family transcriptional regulator [Paractinoplanes hotanensis]|uniref:TetR/AcrR family transcriptional regulator n=1 Tax=Paractinoplanes hotanensis TaxID=2906497 RepID=A0ABT0Y2C7_9ACTN|nr:TetR family transcriptional regulator [Actinoplanes hotanensis]MCM4080142.1 TetR/AcrR family transcriptional regulator [Actinoplanes hotanensis]
MDDTSTDQLRQSVVLATMPLIGEYDTSTDQLRQSVVLATMPLIGEYDTLTTARIAEAAGIGEAELLAVFPDKEAVLRACVAMMTAQMSAMFDATAELARLDAIRVDQPLADRLAEVLGVIDDYHRRVRAEMAAFEEGIRAGTATAVAAGARSSADENIRFMSAQPEARRAVARLLQPEAERLRLPVIALAEAFLMLCQMAAPTREKDRSPLSPGQVIDLFLGGALTAA